METTDAAAPGTPPAESAAGAGLAPAMLQLGARQLVDIWLSFFALGGITVLMLVLWLASLRTLWQIPALFYEVLSTLGFFAVAGGLVAGIVMWRRAKTQVRDHVS